MMGDTTDFLAEQYHRRRLTEHASTLIFGTYSREIVAWAINDPEWQAFRTRLLCTPIQHKLRELTLLANEQGCFDVPDSKLIHKTDWQEHVVRAHRYRVCITNYVNALKRGGLL
jgi:hypothetical protein